MGSVHDKNLWRPNPLGPIYVRLRFRLPGRNKSHTFVQSLGTTSYQEARIARDRLLRPIKLALKLSTTAEQFARYVINIAQDLVDRELPKALEGLGRLPTTVGVLPVSDGGISTTTSRTSAAKRTTKTWGELGAEYREHVRKRKAESTIAKYEGHLKIIDAFLGIDTPVDSITRGRIGELLKHLESKGKHRDTTINQIIAQVGKVFLYGQSMGLDIANPASRVQIPGAQHRAQRAMNHDEADAALALETPKRRTGYPTCIFREFSMIARYTGARIGEIALLRVEDVVVERDVRCLRVRTEKTRSRGGRSYRQNETRLVPIAEKLAATIDAIMGRVDVGEFFPKNGQWKWKRAHYLGKDFNDRVKAIAPDLSFHCWRHYAVTEMRNNGVARDVRTQIVGHQDGSVHELYTHDGVLLMQKAVNCIY